MSKILNSIDPTIIYVAIGLAVILLILSIARKAIKFVISILIVITALSIAGPVISKYQETNITYEKYSIEYENETESVILKLDDRKTVIKDIYKIKNINIDEDNSEITNEIVVVTIEYADRTNKIKLNLDEDLAYELRNYIYDFIMDK